MVPRLDFIFGDLTRSPYYIFFILQKTHLSSTNDTYLVTMRGKSYYGGKGYYIVSFSGGKATMGGKATIQHREAF